MESKIVSLGHRLADRPMTTGVLQRDLFGGVRSSQKLFTMLNIEILDQDRLFKIITVNGVSSVIDIRPVPVFLTPKFSHKEVIRFLGAQKIPYLEYAIARNNSSAFADRTAVKSVGLSVWLYDEEAKKRGWYDNVRQALRAEAIFDAELPFRSLVGVAS